MENKNFNSELTFKMTRSSGKGGQHVNKVSTKVELYFDVLNSQELDIAEKAIIQEKLSSQISNEGVLRVTCQETRSQLVNKDLVIQKFYKLIKKALHVPKRRKPTKTPKGVIEKRLKQKKKRSQSKQLRKKVNIEKDVDFFYYTNLTLSS